MSTLHPETSPHEPNSWTASRVLASRRPTSRALPPLLSTSDATAFPIPLVPPMTISFLPAKFNSIFSLFPFLQLKLLARRAGLVSAVNLQALSTLILSSRSEIGPVGHSDLRRRGSWPHGQSA